MENQPIKIAPENLPPATTSKLNVRLMVAVVIQLAGFAWIMKYFLSNNFDIENSSGFFFGAPLFLLGVVMTIIISARSFKNVFSKIALVITLVTVATTVFYYFNTEEKNWANNNTNDEVIINHTNTSKNDSATNAPVNKNNNMIALKNDALLATNADTDGDGIFNVVEGWYTTSTTKTDTDGDGFTDFQEIDSCNNPIGTGKMALSNFSAYCVNYLAYMVNKGSYDIASGNFKTICDQWAPLAQLKINAFGNEENINLSSFDSDQACSDTEKLANNSPTICLTMEVLTTDLCSVASSNLLAQ